MLPIAFAPAMPDSPQAALVPAVSAAAEARPVRPIAPQPASSRRITLTVEPAETPHPMRVGTGMLIDTFA